MDFSPLLHALAAVTLQCLCGLRLGKWGIGGAMVVYRPGTDSGGIPLDRPVWSRQARQHAVVGRVRLAGLEPGQPARLAGASRGLHSRLACCALSVIVHQLKPRLTFIYLARANLVRIRSPVWITGSVDIKIQIYPCKHLPPVSGGFFCLSLNMNFFHHP